MKNNVQRIILCLILVLIEVLTWYVGIKYSPRLLCILVWINYISLALFHLLFLSLIFMVLLNLTRYVIGQAHKKQDIQKAEKDIKKA